MKNENFKLVLTGLLLIFSVSSLIYAANIIIPESMKLNAEVWGTISDWIIILITLITAVFLYRTLISQQNNLELNYQSLKLNKYDTHYNRALDFIYRQSEIDNKKIIRLQCTIEVLEKYKNEDSIPLYIEDLNTIIYNHFTMSSMVEQFLARTSLSLQDKEYMYIIYDENLPIDFRYITLKVNEQIKALGTKPEDIKCKLLDIYEKNKKQTIVKNFEGQNQSEEYLNAMVHNSSDKESYLKKMQNLINTSHSIIEVRKRLRKPNYKRDPFSFDKNDDKTIT